MLSGRSTAGDGAFVERKRESEAAFTRAAATADWSGSLIARLPPIDAFGYDAGARLERAKADAVAPAGALFPPALAGAISKVDATPRDVARVVADALVDAEEAGGEQLVEGEAHALVKSVLLVLRRLHVRRVRLGRRSDGGPAARAAAARAHRPRMRSTAVSSVD